MSVREDTHLDNVRRLAGQLFADESEREKFIQAVQHGSSGEQSIIILKDRPEIRAFPKLRPAPWQPESVLRVADGFKPAQHPLYAKGAFYSLDLSSVFMAAGFPSLKGKVRTILDVCSAPGGKAILAWKELLSENPKGKLVCSEVMKRRITFLIDNLDRCGITNSSVVSMDPTLLGKVFAGSFDFVIVDAPCSGQSMAARGEGEPGSFAPHAVSECVGRQRRVIGNAAKCVQPGGWLSYMTCTFSREENEKLCAWFLKEFPEFTAVEISALRPYQSALADFPCCRLYPHEGLGAGGFTAMFQRAGEMEPKEIPGFRAVWNYGDEVRRPEPEMPESPPETDSVSSRSNPPRRKPPFQRGRRKAK